MEDHGHQRLQLPSKQTKASKRMYRTSLPQPVGTAELATLRVEFDGYGTIAQQDLRVLPLYDSRRPRTGLKSLPPRFRGPRHLPPRAAPLPAPVNLESGTALLPATSAELSSGGSSFYFRTRGSALSSFRWPSSR